MTKNPWFTFELPMISHRVGEGAVTSWREHITKTLRVPNKSRKQPGTMGISNLRVLYTHPSPELYGSDRMALESAQTLRDAGADVTVAIPQRGPFTDELEKSGIHHIIIDTPVLRKELQRPILAFRAFLRSIAALVRLYRLISSTKPDVVVVNTITTPVWILAAKLARTPAVCHVRENEDRLPKVVQRLLLLPLLAATSIVANSESTRQFVTQAYPGLCPRTGVVLNGKDWRPYQCEYLPINPLRPTILLVGRISPRKGQDVAVKAVSILEQHGICAHMILAGDTFPGYEWYKTEVVQLIKDLKLNERVSFSGFQNDIRGLLNEAQVLLVPSIVEPFGTVALEGMAANRPVVASDVQGLSEIVADNVTGLLVKCGDPRDLALAIRKLCSDPTAAERISAAGFHHATERYSQERYRHDFLEIVSRTVATR